MSVNMAQVATQCLEWWLEASQKLSEPDLIIFIVVNIWCQWYKYFPVVMQWFSYAYYLKNSSYIFPSLSGHRCLWKHRYRAKLYPSKYGVSANQIRFCGSLLSNVVHIAASSLHVQITSEWHHKSIHHHLRKHNNLESIRRVW